MAWLAPSANAQVLLETPTIEPTYPVGSIELQYARPHPDHPALDGLLPVRVELRRTQAGWAEPVEGEPSEVLEVGGGDSPTLALEATGMVQVLVAVVARLHDLGLYGVDVRPSSRDFDLEHEQDRRPPGRDALILEIRVGRVARVRSIAGGDRVTSDWKINNEIHERIREHSPLQPGSDDDTTDLLDRRALEDYLHRLNRHPGRRVEAALSPAEKPGEVVLDYRVLEAKPWFAYAQGTNTGTTRTNRWQTRFGYTHHQLTDRDDILSLEFLNAGIDKVNALSARYEAPFFGPDRPTWMSRRRGDPEWLDWIPREEIPWWGVDRLRWAASLSWSDSEAGETATFLTTANDVVRSREVAYGGRLVYEAFQHRNFFLDVFTGLRLRHLTVKNATTRSEGNAVLVLPRVGLHGEQRSQLVRLVVDVSVQAQLNDIDRSNRIALGRSETQEHYAILDWNFGYSTYLEPVLNPKNWRDPSTHSSSTLAHEIAIGFRGQYAMDNARLIPQANGSLGGFYSVRGYPQSVGVGDSVLVGSIEYRFHVPRVLPVRRQPLDLPLIGDFRAAPQQVYGRPDWDFVLRAFLDIGRSRRNDRSATGPSPPERQQTLIGAGVGAELQLGSNIRARLDWATALKDENRVDDPDPDGDPGVDFGDSEIHVLFSILY